MSASSAALTQGTRLADDLVGHWTFDGPDVTTTVTDRSGQNNHGYFVGGPTSSATSIGKLGQALQFDGTNNVGISGLLGNPTAATLSAWVNLTTSDADGAEVISLGDDVAIRADHPTNGVQGFDFFGGGWHITTTGTSIAGTGWHHVVYVTDPANGRQEVYIDDVLRGSDSLNDPIVYAGNGSNTVIATHGNGGIDSDFIGKIDDVRVYNRALSPTEVKQLYHLGTVRITQ